MQYSDFLKKQIDQLGKVLAQLLSSLLGQVNKGDSSQRLDFTNQVLNTELQLDIDTLINLPEKELIDELQSVKGLSNDNLSVLAEILLLLADNDTSLRRIALYERSLYIFEFLHKNESVYSLDRKWKIERIKAILA